MTDDIDSKPIKEKKVNNKIKINPDFKEAIEEIGGTLIEMVEIDEFDFVVESVYDELIEEGYSEDEVEFGIETALNTLEEGYYDSAVAASKAKTKESSAPKKSMKDRLKSAAKKAIFGASRAIGQAAKAKAAVQAAPGRAKRKVGSIADRVKTTAKAGYKSGRGSEAPSAAHTKTRSSSTYRGAGVGSKEKIGEETEIEEGIGMTMAKAVGNPPALSKRMKLKQALLNREIRKNAAENKKKSYSGKAAVSEAVKGQDTESRKAAAAERKAGDKRLSPSAGKQNADKMERDIKFYDKVTKKTKPSVVGMTHEEVEQVEEGLTDLQRRRYLGRKPGESKERLKRSNERKDKKAALAAMQKQYKGMKAGIYSSYEPEGEQLDEMPYQVMGSPDGGKEKKIGKPVKSKKYADARAAELADTHKKTGGKYRSQYVEGVEQVDEKLNMKKEKMGDVIKDFYKSDAPQFKGKSKEKRRQMAIAAKLTAERGGRKLGEQQEDGNNDRERDQMIANKRRMMQKQQMLQKQQLQMQKQGKLPLNYGE